MDERLIGFSGKEYLYPLPVTLLSGNFSSIPWAIHIAKDGFVISIEQENLILFNGVCPLSRSKDLHGFMGEGIFYPLPMYFLKLDFDIIQVAICITVGISKISVLRAFSIPLNGLNPISRSKDHLKDTRSKKSPSENRFSKLTGIQWRHSLLDKANKAGPWITALTFPTLPGEEVGWCLANEPKSILMESLGETTFLLDLCIWIYTSILIL